MNQAKEPPTTQPEERDPEGHMLLTTVEAFDQQPTAEWLYSLMEQLCANVEETHEAARLHGALRPERIWSKQQPGLMDITEIDPDATDIPDEDAAQWLETTIYSAPEVRENGRLDGRTDVYSLGVLLYVMLTGQEPDQPPRPVAEVKPNETFLDGIDELLQQAMAPDPNERYPTVQHLLDALQSLREAAKGPKQRDWRAIRKKAVKKVTKYIRKRFQKLLLKETILYFRYRPPKEALNKIASRQGSDASKRAARKAARETAKKAGKEAAKKAARQAAKKAAKEAAKKAAKEAAKRMAKRGASRIARQAARRAAKEAAKKGARQLAIHSANAAGTAAIGTASTVSAAIGLAAQAAVLAAGIAAGFIGGEQAITAASRIPAIKRLLAQETPPTTRPLTTPKTQTQPKQNTTRPPTPARRTKAITPKANPPLSNKTCPPNWITLRLPTNQTRQIDIILGKGTPKRIETFFCLPPDSQNATFDLDGYIECSLIIKPKTKTLNIQLKRDRSQILPANYCLQSTTKKDQP